MPWHPHRCRQGPTSSWPHKAIRQRPSPPRHKTNEQGNNSTHESQTLTLKVLANEMDMLLDCTGGMKTPAASTAQTANTTANQRQCKPNVISRAATEMPIMLFFIDLRQGSLRKSRARAEESDNPHPYDGARAAVADGRSHTYDIARAHTSRQSHREGLKRSDARFLRMVCREKQPGLFAEMPHLHKARTYGEIQTSQDRCGSPHPTAYRSYDLFHNKIRF